MVKIEPANHYADDVLTCPVAAAVQTFSGKWKPYCCICCASKKNALRPNRSRLTQGQQKGIDRAIARVGSRWLITRTPTDERRVRVIYALSPLGEELAPILVQLYGWQKSRGSLELTNAA